MFLTEIEIADTSKALQKTCAYFNANRDRIDSFFADCAQRKFTFFGCGSSHMLSKGAAELFRSFPETTACAVAAGDYLLDPDFWHSAMKDSILVAISRSGKTTEMVKAIETAKERYGCPVVSISAEAENDLTPMSDLELTLDWCYDKSVCQTRTVTNLYAATLLLGADYSHNSVLERAVNAAADSNKAFQAQQKETLQKLAALPWENAVVLADGPVSGIAEEGALAFTEIAMLTGRYFHLLDYRHGPIVTSDEKTLTIILLRPRETALQGALVRDVMAHGGPVVTLSEHKDNPFGATEHICIQDIESFAAWGIPLIYIAQQTALEKALHLGGNPDAPKGLDAYIKFEE